VRALCTQLGYSIKLLGIASRIEPFQTDPDFKEEPFRPCVGEANEQGSLPVRTITGGKLEQLQRPVGAPRPAPVVLQRVHPALIPNDTALGSTHGVRALKRPEIAYKSNHPLIRSWCTPGVAHVCFLTRTVTRLVCVCDAVTLSPGPRPVCCLCVASAHGGRAIT
jgi:hypothetical protein